MNDTDLLARFDTLDGELEQGLKQQPSLLDTLAHRYRDAMAGALADVPLGQLQLDGKPFTYHLSRLALGGSPPEGLVTWQSPSGSRPLNEQETYRALRFLRQAGGDLRQLHLDSLKRFWAFTHVNGQQARAWAIRLYREQMHVQMQVRQRDQTLSLGMTGLVADLLQGAYTRLWLGQPMLGGEDVRWPLAGALIISRLDPYQHPSERVVLNTLAHGLEAFESLQALHDELAERLEDERQGPALLNPLQPAQREHFFDCETLTFEPLQAEPFDRLLRQLEQRQQSEVARAWAAAEPMLARGKLEQASEALAEAADLYPLLCSRGPRLTRYVQLVEHRMPAWMHALDQAQRLELVLAMRKLAMATARAIAPGLPSIETFADPASLRAYARELLTRELERLHIDVPPERIRVSVTSAQPGGALVNPLNPSSSVTGSRPGDTGETVRLETHTRDLMQLALENISPLDWDYLVTARVHDDANLPIPGLTAAKVRAMVRRADVGGSYGRHLLARLRYGPEAHWRRERHAALLEATLRLEALRAHHRGQLGPRGRGKAWVDAVLDHPTPSRRPTVAGRQVSVWQLQIRGTPLDGVYVFGPDAENDVSPVLLYAAGGPSRQRWHWFSDRQQLMRQWLNAEQNRAFILGHVALAERTAIAELLGTPRLATHVQARRINHDFFSNAYRSETRLTMANADALSASNREVNARATAEVATTLAEVMGIVLPGRISAVFSLTRALWAFAQAYASLDDEEPGSVALHAFDGFANLFEVATALATSPLFSKLVRRIPLGSPVPLHTPYAVRQQRTFLSYRLATDYSEEVYEAQRKDGGPSEYFIHGHDGRRYQVIHDGEHWRVLDSRMPDAMHKPIVMKRKNGEWMMIDELRWRGLIPDAPALLRRIATPHPPREVTAEPTNIDGKLYARLGGYVLQLRRSLLPGRFTVVIPPAQHPEGFLTVMLRRDQRGRWRAKVRQTSLSSGWFKLA